MFITAVSVIIFLTKRSFIFSLSIFALNCGLAAHCLFSFIAARSLICWESLVKPKHPLRDQTSRLYQLADLITQDISAIASPSGGGGRLPYKRDGGTRHTF